MKKRTLPILLLLAGLSAAALAGCGHEHTYSWKQTEDGTKHYQECECGAKTDEEDHVDADSNGKCDVCDADVHKHEYEWKSDAEKHWQECECEDKINEGAHVDANADDKCDTCGRAYFAVTFAMHNHGTAPDAQKVISGGVATAPATPADDDAYKFKGWFKDEACTQAFDFATDKIEEATVIHAKWEEDTTVGASKKYPHTLTKGEEVLKAVKKGATIYFKYTAEADGRYTVSLGAGVNSQNCTFTTTLTGDTVYGKDQSAEEAHFSLKADESVTVALTFLGEDGEDVTAGVMIDDTTNEPLPADRFLDGEYENSTYTLTLTIDRTEGTILYSGTPYQYSYVGGSIDTLSFTVTLGSLSFTNTLQYNADGTYSYRDGSSGTGKVQTMTYFVAPAKAVALSEIVGYYEPQTAGETHNGITKLYIYNTDSATSTTVIFQRSGYYNTQTATYNTTKNRLSVGNDFTALISYAEDGTVSGISIGGKEYVKKGEAGEVPPETFDIDTGSEYYGEECIIRSPYGSPYFGATGYNKINVIGFADGKYKVVVTVSGEEIAYQMAISADKKTITVYNAESTQIDTLTKFEYIYHDLPTAEQEISLVASDFQKEQVYLFKVKTAGWYQFSGFAEDVSVYYGLSESDPLSTYSARRIGAEAVRFDVDEENEVIVGVFMDTPAATTFTVAPTGTPAGWKENDPKSIVDGTATINCITAGTEFYFELVAPSAGNYLLHVFYEDGTGWDDSAIEYTVNGVLYSFTYDDEDFLTPITATAAGDKCSIVVTTSENLGSKASITVAVVEDLKTGATDIVWSEIPGGKSLTHTANVVAGTSYHIADTKDEEVTFTGTAAFTVTMQGGTTYKAEADEGGAFIATVPAGTDLYFKITSATDQSITVSQSFAMGSKGYPFTASAEEGENTIDLEIGNIVYFTLSAGDYIFSATEDVTIRIGDAYASTGRVVTVKAGDVLSCQLPRWGTATSATVTIAVPKAMFTDAQAGTYKNEDGSVTFTFDKYGSGTYTVKSGPMISGGEITVKAGADNTYTFTYTDESDWFNPVDVTVSFTFVDGKLSVTDTAINSGTAFTLEKEVTEDPVGGGTYTGENYNGAAISITVNADATSGKYVYNDPDDQEFGVGNFDLTIAAPVEGVYTATFQAMGYEGMETFTLKFSIDGDSLTIISDEYFYVQNATLTKVADEEPDEPDVPSEAVTYTGTLTDAGGNDYSVKIVIKGDKADFYVDIGSGMEIEAEDKPITENGGTYTFVAYGLDECSYTIDGDTIEFSHSWYGDGTLTKQA